MTRAIPVGYCQCGCGRQTNPAPYTSEVRGYVKGEPVRYIRGHATRILTPEYTPTDCGYETPCWVWNLSTNHKGYGAIVVKGRKSAAHRVYYEREFGPIPKGLVAHHKCDNRACVNPDHTELVTRAVNTQLGRKAKLTHAEVDQIRKEGWSNNPPRIRDLAARFHVATRTIKSILNNQSWRLKGASSD